MEAKLYYEAHVTIDPVFDDRRTEAERIAKANHFRLAKLIMRKREADTERASQDDTFMTATNRYSSFLRNDMVRLIDQLKAGGFRVRRYKIEDTILDSRHEDELGLL